MQQQEIRRRLKQIMQFNTSHNRKLKRKKFKFDMILIAVLFGLLTVFYNLYASIKEIDFSQSVSIYASPYPTLTAYVIHLLFTLAMDSMLVLWIYKPSECCKYYKRRKSLLQSSGTDTIQILSPRKFKHKHSNATSSITTFFSSN